MKLLRASRSRSDFILAPALASLLFITTACGGAPAPAAAQAPTETAAPSSQSQAPTETADLAADLAGNARPALAATALDLLATLPVKGRAPKTGYSRAEFGHAWADVDRNGCDTRNDILGRDLTAKTFRPGTRDCLVLTGVLADPYTARTISFVRGQTTSTAVQIDHVVALSDAWQKGAQQLSAERRTAFANDPLNLLAVDGPTNQQKSDGDAATWLPPHKDYRCPYVARQISVKAAYGLWVTRAEHDAMARILNDCAGVEAPAPAPAPAPPAPAPAAPVAPAPAPPAPAPLMQPPGASVHYQNCAAVRAAGAAPIRAGQPGFEPKFDRDGDGVGCE
ncbi:GmrSD restriction endonuclease domain-containing protein [Specibacter sp. RAF43]|uniref:GmrSD restriction endonuclease domain-containing protein n=1 Tax=Specibacter sp. RAF43 TaxID=3233057 RepID=UPI003F9C1EF0